MKLAWTIAHLSSAALEGHSSQWELENSYAASREIATTVLEVGRESLMLNDCARNFYHADCIRASTVLLQLLLRTVIIERTQQDRFLSSCREGIVECRALIPKVLARTEDTIEKLLNEYCPE
jgi:predicted short-subunit dehydrogenase-like oxidoreductase (DUF2520 family)